ncbi:DNA breaking-rejoining enzyme [Armillaria gallica]|uniref:DNA breaking-rejoining enzyme n=1 Tax=Armillaria gallica TaxID=47427 RepID=A0A2H3CK01_ARMGA|nr:DNA breaking-rejoining enzyme [Armillaria gallica]
MSAFNDFLVEESIIQPGTNIFTVQKLDPNIDYYIVGFIMKQCDDIDMHGISRGPNNAQKSYSNATKLRAGTTYGFRKSGRRGKVPWSRATALGNPSISDLVSSYMLGLHKRKVTKGETSTSARAIGPDTLRRLYEHNHKPENWNNEHLSQGNWCGGNTRRLLQAVYLIAFTCLLRIDEVLNLQAHEVDVYDNKDDIGCMSITLPFRKNAPVGGIPPFVLQELPEQMAHLCPVRAFSAWISASRINKGNLFPNIDKRDRPKAEVFLQLFQNNLWNLDIIPYPYGTHSFRRGGCQWFACELRWSIRQICEWGGWSTDFSHLTIVKYLISANDTPTLRRDEFFKLDRQVVKCMTCGRTCPCA